MPKLHDMDVDQYLLDCVTLNELDLESDMIKYSSELAYWNGRTAQALEKFLFAKVETKRARARLAIDCRLELDQAGKEAVELDPKAKAKAPTESMVAAAIEDRPEVHEIDDNAIRAEVEWVRVRGVADAIHSKGDMLRSLSSRLKMELMSDPIVRKDLNAQRTVRNNE